MDVALWLDQLEEKLPRHARYLRSLSGEAASGERWRWLFIGCSIAAGRGDELSDLDLALGFDVRRQPEVPVPEVEAMLHRLGSYVDLLSHKIEGAPTKARRFAVEYLDGVQVDLVVAPAEPGSRMPTGSIALVDKDGTMQVPATPPTHGTPPAEQVREWAFLAWWALSDATKYLHRDSVFEAVERVSDARGHALRLWATGNKVPSPAFGLTSLLDFPPFETPPALALTYCRAEHDDVVAAAMAVADLLDEAMQRAGTAIEVNIAMPLSGLVRKKIERHRRT